MALILWGSYLVGVACYVYRMVSVRERRMVRLLSKQQEDLAQLLTQQGRLRKQKEILGEEYHREFVLYGLTKEIISILDEGEAFELFKKHLRENIAFQSCRLFDPLDAEVSRLKKEKDWFVFALRGKRQLIGYLAVEGVAQAHKEIVRILGHQFVLALRRIKLHQDIEQVAISDSLTPVYTRRYTLERFSEEYDRAKVRHKQLSFMMIDIDHFKAINDQHGHLVGDQILREIGRLIRENIREIDIAGRYGGEEFCVVLPESDHQGAYHVAERIRQSVGNRPIKAYDTAHHVTVSIGAATYPQDGHTEEALIDKADWALYRAKKQGRNQTCVVGLFEAP